MPIDKSSIFIHSGRHRIKIIMIINVSPTDGDASGASFRLTLPVSASGWRFRGQLPADASGVSFRLTLPVSASGWRFRCQLPADASGVSFRLTLPGSASSWRCRVNYIYITFTSSSSSSPSSSSSSSHRHHCSRIVVTVIVVVVMLSSCIYFTIYCLIYLPRFMHLNMSLTYIFKVTRQCHSIIKLKLHFCFISRSQKYVDQDQ